MKSHGGAFALLDENISNDDTELAARIIGRFSQGRDAELIELEFATPQGEARGLLVSPFASNNIRTGWQLYRLAGLKFVWSAASIRTQRNVPLISHSVANGPVLVVLAWTSHSKPAGASSFRSSRLMRNQRSAAVGTGHRRRRRSYR
jgi:hypothetical protein